MATFSETKHQRFAASESELDSFGRSIKVQRLLPWDAQMVRRIVDSDRINVVSPGFIAACVREIIDEQGVARVFTPPKSESDLAVIFNLLDEEGLAAATIAYARLRGYKLDGAEDAPESKAPASGAEAVKNS